MEKINKFRKELEELINRYSLENGSNTPDFMIADYLIKCLEVFDKTVQDREHWYGRGIKVINNTDDINLEKIERVYNEVKGILSQEETFNDKITRSRLSILLKEKLGESSSIICDESNNYPEILANGSLMARIMWNLKSDGSFSYIDLDFGYNKLNIIETRHIPNLTDDAGYYVDAFGGSDF